MCRLLVVNITKAPHIGGRLRGVEGIENGDIISMVEDGLDFGNRGNLIGDIIDIPGVTCAQFSTWINEEETPRLALLEDDPGGVQIHQHSDSKWYEVVQEQYKFPYSTSNLTVQDKTDLASGGRAAKEAAIRKMKHKMQEDTVNLTTDRTTEKEAEDTKIGETRTGR